MVPGDPSDDVGDGLVTDTVFDAQCLSPFTCHVAGPDADDLNSGHLRVAIASKGPISALQKMIVVILVVFADEWTSFWFHRSILTAQVLTESSNSMNFTEFPNTF